MSEVLNNREYRQAVLKETIRDLYLKTASIPRRDGAGVTKGSYIVLEKIEYIR